MKKIIFLTLLISNFALGQIETYRPYNLNVKEFTLGNQTLQTLVSNCVPVVTNITITENAFPLTNNADFSSNAAINVSYIQFEGSTNQLLNSNDKLFYGTSEIITDDNLPIATTNLVGGIKVGSNLNIDTNGTLNVPNADANTSTKGVTYLLADAFGTYSEDGRVGYAITEYAIRRFIKNSLFPYPIFQTTNTYTIGDRVQYKSNIYECLEDDITGIIPLGSSKFKVLDPLQVQIDNINNAGYITINDLPPSMTNSINTNNFVSKTSNGSVTVGHRNSTNSSGIFSFGSGTNVTASGNYSIAVGRNASATATGSHAEGFGTQASGTYSHAEGNSSKALEGHSHAEGYSSQATGYGAHAEGGYYRSSSANSVGGIASGDCSHAEGGKTEASGLMSHAAGYNSSASNNYSFTWSGVNSSTKYGSHGNGTFNINPDGGASGFYIGNTTLQALINAGSVVSSYKPETESWYVLICNSGKNKYIVPTNFTENIVHLFINEGNCSNPKITFPSWIPDNTDKVLISYNCPNGSYFYLGTNKVMEIGMLNYNINMSFNWDIINNVWIITFDCGIEPMIFDPVNNKIYTVSDSGFKNFVTELEW